MPKKDADQGAHGGADYNPERRQKGGQVDDGARAQSHQDHRDRDQAYGVLGVQEQEACDGPDRPDQSRTHRRSDRPAHDGFFRGRAMEERSDLREAQGTHRTQGRQPTEQPFVGRDVPKGVGEDSRNDEERDHRSGRLPVKVAHELRLHVIAVRAGVRRGGPDSRCVHDSSPRWVTPCARPPGTRADSGLV